MSPWWRNSLFPCACMCVLQFVFLNHRVLRSLDTGFSQENTLGVHKCREMCTSVFQHLLMQGSSCLPRAHCQITYTAFIQLLEITSPSWQELFFLFSPFYTVRWKSFSQAHVHKTCFINEESSKFSAEVTKSSKERGSGFLTFPSVTPPPSPVWLCACIIKLCNLHFAR